MAWFLKGLARFVAWLPLGWALGLGRGVAWVLANVARIRRGYVLEALAQSLPEKTDRERLAVYRSMWRHQMTTVVELMRFAGGRAEEVASRMEAVGADRVRAARERGKGVLILIAHFGNYPLLALQVPRLFDLPLSIIAKPLRNEVLNELWWEMLRKAGVNGIPSRNAYRASVRSLRNNELVGFMLDQNRPAAQGVFVDFFGRLASTTPGLAFMSAQTGAPVMPVFIRRLPDGSHRVVAGDLIEPPPDRKDETILSFTARYTRLIEDEIRQDPDQWLWLHKRWKSRPPDEERAVTGGDADGMDDMTSADR